MPQKRFSKISILTREKNVTIEILNRAVSEIRKSGYTVMPSAQAHLGKSLLQARKKGTLKTNYETVIAASAFIAASAQVSPRHKITVKDIEAGWNELRQCPPTVPPPQCMRRSIIAREQTLRRELPGFPEIVDSVMKRG